MTFNQNSINNSGTNLTGTAAGLTAGIAVTLVNDVSVATAPQIDVSGQAGITVTTGSNASIAPSGSGYYKIAIAETGLTGASAEYICGNGVCAMGASALASSKGWVASTTTPAAGDFSIAYNTGTSHYCVYNNQGATIVVKTFLVKLG